MTRAGERRIVPAGGRGARHGGASQVIGNKDGQLVVSPLPRLGAVAGSRPRSDPLFLICSPAPGSTPGRGFQKGTQPHGSGMAASAPAAWPRCREARETENEN